MNFTPEELIEAKELKKSITSAVTVLRTISKACVIKMKKPESIDSIAKEAKVIFAFLQDKYKDPYKVDLILCTIIGTKLEEVLNLIERDTDESKAKPEEPIGRGGIYYS